MSSGTWNGVCRAVTWVCLCWCVAGVAQADEGVRYVGVAADPSSGIGGYVRHGSSTVAIVEAIHRASLEEPVPLTAMAAAPMMPRGLPGVAILDFDGDGDLDLYVTNGPGHANSLLSNQLAETGAVRFVDVAVAAGADATEQDSFGTCFGDLDNDGDPDLVVLGRLGPNLILENNGDGTFQPIIQAPGVDGGDRTSSSCSTGDVDGDGLLDIVIANTFDQTVAFAIFAVPFDDNEPNQLLRNLGGMQFEDISATSGITVNDGYPEGAAGITWSTAMADVDADGDVDIFFMDDQGAILSSRFSQFGGFDRAFIHVFINDGAGRFQDHALLDGPNAASEWMGVSVGDLNCDGHLDFLASTFGDYGNGVLGLPYVQPGSTTRPFFGRGDGSFDDPGHAFGVAATPFGWGNAVYDYDNDGDLDLLFHGGLDAANAVVLNDNPGVILRNDGCTGVFTEDLNAIQVDHQRRNVRGVAVGDLNADGFEDIVTVANLTIPAALPRVPVPATYGSPYDATAVFAPIMFPVGVTPEGVPTFVWSGLENGLGDLEVELAVPNGNRSATVDLIGTVGLVTGARSNRDGIGAQVTLQPYGSPHRTMQAVTGGSSHASQHALDRVFGLAKARGGIVEVRWPGGTLNRHYFAREGLNQLPEIPCSIDTDAPFHAYAACVGAAFDELRRARLVPRRDLALLQASALLAYFDQ